MATVEVLVGSACRPSLVACLITNILIINTLMDHMDNTRVHRLTRMGLTRIRMGLTILTRILTRMDLTDLIINILTMDIAEMTRNQNTLACFAMDVDRMTV